MTSLLSKKTALLILITILLSGACTRKEPEMALGEKKFIASDNITHEWLGAYFEGKKIGHIHTVTSQGTLNGKAATQVRSYAAVEVNVAGEKSRTELDQTGYLDSKSLLDSFIYRQSIMGHEMLIRGEREGDDLIVEINTGSEKRRKSFPFKNNLYTTGLIKSAILKREFKEGDEFEVDIFLEPLLAVETVNIKVLSKEKGYVNGKETVIYTFEESFKGIRGNITLTADGTTLEEVSPNGFKLIREDEKSARAGVQSLFLTDMLLASRIEVEKPLPDPRGMKSMSIRLSHIPEAFPVISDERQKVSLDGKSNEGLEYLFEINRSEPEEKGVTIPVADRQFTLYLGSDHVVNSDNKEIVKKAGEIVGNEKSALKAAKLIYDWVYKNIDKKLIDTVSALDTLKSGEGECQAHSNLFAALARAAGIPTKVISGIVYSKDFEGFMYHAWNEIYTGEWIAVDATLGGFPADATHIKLAEGGLEEQLKIMALVGKVKAEVVEGKE